MTTTLQTFDFKSIPVRVAGSPESPLFVAADVCAVLEIADHTTSTRDFDEDEKGTHTVRTLGGIQEMVCVTEPGLYRLIFRSRKKEAKEFQRWVCHEVLPAIRSQGFYQLAPIDFTKYPVASSFNDLFLWLRSMGIEPNTAAESARTILCRSVGMAKPEKGKLK